MTQFKYELGEHVEDIITRFKGVITGRADYLTGCLQYGVTAIKTKDEIKHSWFDEGRIKKTKGKKIVIEKKSSRNITGGPQSTPDKI